MTALKLTKNELRSQQTRLTQLERYLPTLQLKKSLLQFEVHNVQLEVQVLKQEFSEKKTKISEFSFFLLEKVSCDLLAYADIHYVSKHYENIAGVEIPVFESISFRPATYSLLDTPVWTDAATEMLREFVLTREKLAIVQEKKRALEKELREVSIRVNLFEKILIPRARENLKKIRIFLSDQQLTSVAQAKVAKSKIQARKLRRDH